MEQPPRYPTQRLTDQHVAPGRRRGPWLLVAGVLVVALIAGVVVWQLLDDGGEDRREAYCQALFDITDGGDLANALDSADQETLQALERLAGVAPDAVSSEWDRLARLLEEPASLDEAEALSTALGAYSAVRAIARDAEDECGLTLNIPLE